MTRSALLSLHQANVRAGGQLFLRELDWCIGAGEQWGLVGGNGAGKTLLAQVLLQRHPLSSGSLRYRAGIQPQRDLALVSVEAQDALCAADARHDISEFSASATDSGTVLAQLILRGQPADRRFEALVARLKLERLLSQGLRFLSSGEMRKALLAAALWRRPTLLILDNPLEGLDQEIRATARDLLLEAAAEGQQLLQLARQPGELLDCISRLCFLRRGRLEPAGADAPVSQSQRAATTAALQLPEPAAGRRATTGVLVEMCDVACSYGERQVLQGVNCRIEAGQHTWLRGPNGAGKSTILSLICGDNSRAYGQQLSVFGERRGAGSSIWELKQRIGIVSNALHRQYPARCRVLDVLVSGFYDSLGLYQGATAAQYRAAEAWWQALELHGGRRLRLQNLSFGDQRLLLIARAVIKEPPLLILDEPCSGLDEKRSRQVLALIDAIAARGGTTVLYVSHEAEQSPRCIRQTLTFQARRDVHYRLESRAMPRDST